MTALTPKQRVKVHAALAIIHDHGFNANAVTHAARAFVARGYDARRSYEMAINDFAKHQPDILPNLVQATRLVEASDEATLAQYDAALNQYIQTGDLSGINALAPMIAQDSIELAVRNGEVPPEAVNSVEGLEMAMGFAPSDGMAEAFSTAPPVAPPQPSAPPSAVPAQPASFAFARPNAPQAPGPSYVNDRQTSSAGAMGVRAPMSADRQRAWAGLPTGSPGVRTASGGYRPAMTGEKLARWTGVPLASVSGEAPE